MFEKKTHPLAPKSRFYRRQFKSILIAGVLMAFSLLVGVMGYHFIAGLEWIDSLLNASMILGGMGPVDIITNNGGKIFASIYALYSGISFLSAFSIILAPAFHRVLHKFHLSDEDDKE